MVDVDAYVCVSFIPSEWWLCVKVLETKHVVPALPRSMRAVLAREAQPVNGRGSLTSEQDEELMYRRLRELRASLVVKRAAYLVRLINSCGCDPLAKSGMINHSITVAVEHTPE